VAEAAWLKGQRGKKENASSELVHSVVPFKREAGEGKKSPEKKRHVATGGIHPASLKEVTARQVS